MGYFLDRIAHRKPPSRPYAIWRIPAMAYRP